MKETLIVLYGGRSAEREVSVLSAESVVRAVNYQDYQVQTYFISQDGRFFRTQVYQEKPADDDRLMTNQTIDEDKLVQAGDIYQKDAIVFPVLHGPMGEDGTLQGFLEVLGLAYVGANVLYSAVAMDKISTKRVLEVAGVAQVPYVALVDGDDWNLKMDEIEANLTYPVFTKPSNMGSSVGISKVENREQLKDSLELAFRYDSRVLVEQGVHAREIEVGLLGNFRAASTLPGEVVKDVDFYDYQAKYIDNKITMAIPADLPETVMGQMRDQAEKAYQALGGMGLSRCDFFYTEDGQIYLNELNTMPGFTQWSMFPLLWENMGLSYSDLIQKLVDLAKEAHAKRESHMI